MKKFTFKHRIEIVVVGGMSQAGSTLCFNLCRLLCEKAGERVGILQQDLDHCSFVSPPKHPNQKLRLIYKQHDLAFDAPMRSPLYFGKKDGSVAKAIPMSSAELVEFKVVNVIRDIRDCAASYIRKNNNVTEEDLSHYVRQNYYYSTCWEALADCAWIYETYKNSPIKVLTELAQVLEVTLTQEQILEIYEEAENLHDQVTPDDTTSEFYQMTKLHSSQRTNEGKIGDYFGTLTEKQIELLETNCEQWLYRYGYLDWTT